MMLKIIKINNSIIISNGSYFISFNAEPERWITVKGNHIPLFKGKDVSESIRDFFQAHKRAEYISGGKGGSIKINDAFKGVLRNVQESNKKNITSESVINDFLKQNPKIDINLVKKEIKKAEDYKLEKEFVNDKGEKQYIDTQLVNSFETPEGRLYTKERKKIHNKIYDYLLKNESNAKPKDGESPTFVILGGRGGSGKSKLNGLAYDPDKFIKIDPDEIKEMLPEYNGSNAWEVHEESSDMSKELLKIARQKGLNVVLDGTMSGYDSAKKKINDFKDSGYNIEGYYMHLPRELSAVRGVSRFATGGSFNGRYVPVDIMLGMRNNEDVFSKLLPDFKRWGIWDNNVPRGEEPKPIQMSWNKKSEKK